ncbi:hypothetical protein BDZ94DRAFT_1301712 [Collybia nuda]|uniref:F-box domain-containing protein n=1 Tax=Collybia nuda TaxID=64659 RepID=A0A9P6CE58_9AGAR|nr:hypothetical protein BDZ94DRAFT_1301712 [Collybia nuda]
MGHRDDSLTEHLLELERSSQKPTNTENAYLRTHIAIINAERRQVEMRLAMFLSRGPQRTNCRSIPSKEEEDDAHISPELFGTEAYQLKVTFALLLAERSYLTRQLGRCHSALAPYSKLPPELVREIILLCLPEKFHSLPLWLGTMDFRLKITQVCMTWRRVAFSMPELWQIYLSNSDHSYKSSISLAKAWFLQSSASNLGLKILGSWRNSIFPKVNLVLFFDAIFSNLVVPFASRFKTLGSLVVNKLQWELLFTLPLDNLITLSLNFQRLGESSESRQLLTVPSLREIQFINMPSIKILSAFPLDQLTSMTLTGSITTGNLQEVLEQCSMLQACDLREISGSSLTPLDFEKTITLENLTSLCITFTSAKYLGWLSVFRTPRLVSLVLSALPATLRSLEAFVGYISRVSNTLRRFQIIEISKDRIYGLDIPSVEPTLRAMPSITDLFLPEAYAICLPTLERIGMGELIPNIERIEFTGMGPVATVVDLLIPPQSNRPPRLKTVRIYSLMFGLGLDPPRVQDLRREGLDIRLETLW